MRFTRPTVPVRPLSALLLCSVLVACDPEPACGVDEVQTAGLALLGPTATSCDDEACLLQAHQDGSEAWIERETGRDERQWFFTTADGELWLLYDDLGDGRARQCLDPYPTPDGVECTSVEPAGDFYRICGSSRGASLAW